MQILRKVWQFWKRVGQAIGDLIARVVLSVFYFTLMLPFGLGVRLFGDPLGIRHKSQTLWMEPPARDLGIEDARRLF